MNSEKSITVEISINGKYASIWLTRQQQNDIEIQSLVEAATQELSKKYTVVIYKAGTGDIVETLTALILNNLKPENQSLDIKTQGSEIDGKSKITPKR